MTEVYTTQSKYWSPRIESMEKGLRPPHSSPFDKRPDFDYPSSTNNVEEGQGFYSMNRPNYPYTTSSPVNEQELQPTIWQKVKRTLGLGGKRRRKHSTRKTTKSKKSKKSKKSRKTMKTRKSRKLKRNYKKRGGTTRKVWIAEGKTPNGYYGGSVVNPYSPPMDFAPISGIPTAKPHHMVG